ncbi:hypothetical protein C2G38_2095591 [Gigaspora rosea]|uniref:Uncharacterized protein n=1 Tax=Gigaspora rosea TaxID=44941 RepID=A0A397UZG2_9GLOM|nr:hypothetical protein C2G38_2095591 [Gigaspora rosea]
MRNTFFKVEDLSLICHYVQCIRNINYIHIYASNLHTVSNPCFSLCNFNFIRNNLVFSNCFSMHTNMLYHVHQGL